MHKMMVYWYFSACLLQCLPVLMTLFRVVICDKGDSIAGELVSLPSKPPPLQELTDNGIEQTKPNFTSACEGPSSISLLWAQTSENSIRIEWKPLHPECISFYQLLINGEDKLHVTNATQYHLSQVQYCMDYGIMLTAIYDGQRGKTSFLNISVPLPTNFSYQVQDISMTVNQRNGRIHWAPPENVTHCIRFYNVTWMAHTWNTTAIYNSTEFETQIKPCTRYTITVTPVVNGTIVGLPATIVSVTPSKVQTSPQLTSLNLTQSSAISWWQFDSYDENPCEVQNIITTCEDEVNKKHVKVQFQVQDMNPRHNVQVIIDGLSPYTKYVCRCVVENIGGPSNVSEDLVFRTLETVPSQPNVTLLSENRSSFWINWTHPEPGPFKAITAYKLLIISLGPLHYVPQSCKIDKDHIYINVAANVTTFSYHQGNANYNYSVQVSAATTAGFGPYSDELFVTTKESEPEPARNVHTTDTYSEIAEPYSGQALVQFDFPCNTNGPFHTFQMWIVARRPEYTDQIEIINSSSTSYTISLLPDRDYEVKIMVITAHFSASSSTVGFHSRPGVPPKIDINRLPKVNNATSASFELRKTDFNDSNGLILYYAIFMTTSSNVSLENYGFWQGTIDTWPDGSDLGDFKEISQPMWNPFVGSSDVRNVTTFYIGTDSNCSNSSIHCNKYLLANSEYTLVVRALTAQTYRDSWPIRFKTGNGNVVWSMGLLAAIALLLSLCLCIVMPNFVFMVMRKRQQTTLKCKIHICANKHSVNQVPSDTIGEQTTSNGCQELGASCALKQKHDILQEFQMLEKASKELNRSTYYSQLPENKRKNRYTNILPFDDNRVKLLIDEDDEIGSDFINASYIKGISGNVEYIATQGPLSSTCKDFWKMILQENVSIIVMVAQFEEQGREKCFKYLPNNGERINMGGNFSLFCTTELCFGMYSLRSVQIQKDNIERNVVHMQFLDWPDFGVPSSTDHMIQFCRQYRSKVNADRIANNIGLTLVHCSAGVGRTGTFIAIDILLQQIDKDHNEPITIFNTILELRKQRTNMVQTDRQYLFIHNCIAKCREKSRVKDLS